MAGATSSSGTPRSPPPRLRRLLCAERSAVATMPAAPKGAKALRNNKAAAAQGEDDDDDDGAVGFNDAFVFDVGQSEERHQSAWDFSGATREREVFTACIVLYLLASLLRLIAHRCRARGQQRAQHKDDDVGGS